MFVRQISRDRRLGALIHRFIHEESGNLESALVLIPTMILFLSVLQIAIAALLHGYAINDAQGTLSRSALLASAHNSAQSNNSLMPNSSGNSNLSGGASVYSTERIPLPGNGNLLVGTLTRKLPIITPLLPFAPELTVKSFAVDEN